MRQHELKKINKENLKKDSISAENLKNITDSEGDSYYHLYDIKGYEKNNGIPVIVIENVHAKNEEDALNQYVHIHPNLKLFATKRETP